MRSPTPSPFAFGAGVNEIHVNIDKKIKEDCADPYDAPGWILIYVGTTTSVRKNDIPVDQC